jgi:S-(hydroxymethyl)glutathione dehydrogenase / alcohol dehydrogenase
MNSEEVMIMKAAICYEYGKPLVIEDVNIDPPQKGEVKVRLAATAVCHSDIHCAKGDFAPFQPVPFVPGHESSGYVDTIGEGVTAVKPGDNVIVTLLASCHQCVPCLTGHPSICEGEWPLMMGTRLHNKKGQALYTNKKMANYAECVIVDQSQLVKIPKDIPMDVAALLACGVITGFGSVVNRVQVKPMNSVVVIGTGGVGLNSLQGAFISGANPIIAVDISDTKLNAARSFGATHTVNSAKEDVVKAVKDLTGGRGADFSFVTVGSTAAMMQGFFMTCRRGTTVIVGAAPLKDSLTIPPIEFIEFEKVLTGASMGSTNISIDIPRMISLYQQGRLKLRELISNRYPLEQINEAFRNTEQGGALRNLIMF